MCACTHVCVCVCVFAYVLCHVQAQWTSQFQTVKQKFRDATSKSFHHILFYLVKIQFTFYIHKKYLSQGFISEIHLWEFITLLHDTIILLYSVKYILYFKKIKIKYSVKYIIIFKNLEN